MRFCFFLLFGQMGKERKKMASKSPKKDLQKKFLFFIFFGILTVQEKVLRDSTWRRQKND